jgi:hypothetical protein
MATFEVRAPHVVGDDQPLGHVLPPPHLLLVCCRCPPRRRLVPSLGGSFRIPSNGPSASRKKKEWVIRVRAGRGRDHDGQCVEEHAHLCHDLGFGEIVVRDARYEGAYRLTFRGKGRGEQCLCLSPSPSRLIKNGWRRLIATVSNEQYVP